MCECGCGEGMHPQWTFAGPEGFTYGLAFYTGCRDCDNPPGILLYRIPNAEIEDDERTRCEVSTGERRFCRKCGSALWLYDPTWPELVHPFASAVDTELPKAPERVHIMLKYKASWVEPDIRKGDRCFDLYPEDSIADWHKRTKMWVE